MNRTVFTNPFLINMVSITFSYFYSIIGILKDKEYMFPCFEISQKDDLFQVMVYLATENQLCPDPTPKSEEETIHQEIDSLMGLGLILCYK